MVNCWAVRYSRQISVRLTGFQFSKDIKRRNAWIVIVGRLDYGSSKRNPKLLRQTVSSKLCEAASMDERGRQCCLVLDEMEITEALEYDASNSSVIGGVTLPGHSGLASHSLVVIFGGW
ncbi:uncharacterized protein [Watersipora subatra]|uniref:uncharacterized protein n=1 Tax=Watersipora subatra TaxID=2589382 RepID=UPI00355B4584